MAIIVINEAKGIIINFGREGVGILGRGGGDGSAEGSVGVVDNVSLNIHEVGDVFITIVEVVGEDAGRREEDERAGGDGFRGIPNVRVGEGVVGATELLEAETNVNRHDNLSFNDLLIDCRITQYL